MARITSGLFAWGQNNRARQRVQSLGSKIKASDLVKTFSFLHPIYDPARFGYESS